MKEDPAQALLVLCARPRLPAELLPEVARRAACVDAWDTVPDLAEQHGLGPLLHAHAASGALLLPIAVRQQLLGLYVRHRHGAAMRLDALAEILRAFAENGIESRVLKGMALASLVYGDPALRPMSDLDLLVAPQDAFRAQRLLRELGFHAPAEGQARLTRHHHLPPAVRRGGGVTVQVELHHNVFPLDTGLSLQVSEANEPPVLVDILGRQARALGLCEMLWHLCRHLTRLWTPLRLIWVADVLGYAEVFGARIDWERVRRQYPSVIGTLTALDAWTPLRDDVRERARLSRIDGLRDVGRDYTGWPRPRIQAPGGGSRPGRLRNTVSPPEWWLLLRYGTDEGMSAARRLRNVRRRHLAAVVAAAGWYLRKAVLMVVDRVRG